MASIRQSYSKIPQNAEGTERKKNTRRNEKEAC